MLLCSFAYVSCDPITFSSLRVSRQRSCALCRALRLSVDQLLACEISKAVSELRGYLKVRSGGFLVLAVQP